MVVINKLLHFFFTFLIFNWKSILFIYIYIKINMETFNTKLFN